jgi:excisionase family DNA binding protein
MTTQFSSTAPLLSIRDAAKFFGVGFQTVSRWHKDGSLRGFKLCGSIRFRTEDIDQFIADNERKREAVTV